MSSRKVKAHRPVSSAGFELPAAGPTTGATGRRKPNTEELIMNNPIPISFGRPPTEPDDVRTLVEIDHRRASIGVHVATDPTRPSRTSSSLWLPPDMAEALANELLRAVQAWRVHETTVAWTQVRPANGGRA